MHEKDDPNRVKCFANIKKAAEDFTSSFKHMIDCLEYNEGGLGEIDSLNNVFGCSVLLLFRISDLSVSKQLAVFSFKFIP